MTTETRAKHTPGPWGIEIDTPDQRRWGYVRREDDRQGVVAIARIMVRGDSHEYIANARLIAAAPELLEAAHEAYIRISGWDTGVPFLVKMLRDAIAKAIGEQP